jgi:hypothetical protein
MLSIRINLVQNQALVTATRFGFLRHQKALVLLFLNFGNHYLTCHPHHQLLCPLPLILILIVRSANEMDISHWTVLIR